MELPAQRKCKLTIYSKVREVIKRIFAIGIPTEEVEKKKSLKACLYWSILCQRSFLIEFQETSGQVLHFILWFLFLSVRLRFSLWLCYLAASRTCMYLCTSLGHLTNLSGHKLLELAPVKSVVSMGFQACTCLYVKTAFTKSCPSKRWQETSG